MHNDIDNTFVYIFFMKNFWIIFLCIIIIPSFAYEVFSPDSYKYYKSGNKLLFVIDFSNSMSEFLEGKTKVDLVKEMMNFILPQISSDTQIGLRVYGHTCNVLAYNACRSSELIVPVEFDTSNQITNNLLKIKPRGMTPITYSLKQAVKKDLAGLDGIKHIILLTDGGENCDESPCDYAIDLVKTRRDVKIDVIAFNVHDSDDLAQLECTADVTSGNFVKADTKAQLFNSMESMIVPHKNVEAVIYNEK